MKVGRAFTLVAVCLLASACYRQVVNTGRTPGTTVIDKPWTPFFLWGLVAHPPMDVSSQCPNGIATVVTEQTFVNGLVSLIALFGVYSPRHVTITCAGRSAMRPGSTEFTVARDASAGERERVFTRAIEESERTGQPIVIRF
jgi:hypothetical protein